jgi:hypothetical protein
MVIHGAGPARARQFDGFTAVRSQEPGARLVVTDRDHYHIGGELDRSEHARPESGGRATVCVHDRVGMSC